LCSYIARRRIRVNTVQGGLFRKIARLKQDPLLPQTKQ
jgi:hypothetical protein